MSIKTYLPNVKDSIFYDETFRKMIEDHMGIIMANSFLYNIEPRMAAAWRGDFYGMLTENVSDLPVAWHWITLRLNGLLSPTDYSGQGGKILVPNYVELSSNLIAVYNSK